MEQLELNDLGVFLQDTTPDYTRLRPGTHWMAVGFEKSGKTTAFSSFSEKGEDGVLIFDLEQGVRVRNKITIPISSYKTPYDENGIIKPIDRGLVDASGNPIQSLSIEESLDLLENTWKNSGKTTLVLDTVDKLNLWCTDLAFKEIVNEESLKKAPNLQILNASGPDDIPYAAAHTRGRGKVIKVVEMIKDIIKDNGVLILLSHLKKAVVISEGRDVIVKRIPAMPEGLAARLGYDAEAIATLEVDAAGKHWCDFRGYSEVVMGTRIEPLNGKKLIWEKHGKNSLYNVVMKEMSK